MAMMCSLNHITASFDELQDGAIQLDNYIFWLIRGLNKEEYLMIILG